MKIVISGKPGSGKSTVARALAGKLGLRYFSTGQFMRELARKQGISLEELGRQAESSRQTDSMIDDWQARLGMSEDDFVMDGRLGFHFIPDSVKIFLDVDSGEAARRIFAQKREDEHASTQEELQAKLEERMASEKRRYMKYYNLDPYALKHYDLVIDTSKLTPAQVLRKITGFVSKSK